MGSTDKFPTSPKPAAPRLSKRVQKVLICILLIFMAPLLLVIIPCFIIRGIYSKYKLNSNDRAVQKQASETATAVCYLRTIFHNAGLINDPYAVHFLPLLVRLIPMVNTCFRWITSAPALDSAKSGILGFVLGRTVMGQDAIANAIKRGYKNIVLLGAGFDTKFHRCEIPKSIKLFEVDSRPTQEAKLKVLEKLGGKHNFQVNKDIVYTTVDFNTQNFVDRLEECGFDASQPTLFLWEGVIYYLDPEAVTTTLKLIRERVAEADIFLDIFREFNEKNCRLHNGYPTKMKEQVARLGEPFRFGLEDEEVESFFLKEGFAIIEWKRPKDIEEQYSRYDDGTVWEEINPMGSLLYLRKLPVR